MDYRNLIVKFVYKVEGQGGSQAESALHLSEKEKNMV